MDTIQQNIKQIKNAGFDYLKIEIECNINDCEEHNSYYDIEQDMRTALDRMDIEPHYIECYYDSSVDTELTLTIDTAHADKLPRIMRAFYDIACEFAGYELAFDHAGLHIAVLNESRYPCSYPLDERKLNNFKTEVNRLMPALVFLSTTGDKTRSLYYRYPRISYDKYSMIHILNGGFEYRMFDPCTDTDKVLEYINVIAQTLKYYSKRKLKNNLYDLFSLEYNESEQHINKYFGTIENQTALRACLPYIIRDKQALIEKTKRLPKLKKSKQWREQNALLRQYYAYIEAEQKFRRDRFRQEVREQKAIAERNTCLEFDKTKMFDLYKKLVERSYLSYEEYKQRHSYNGSVIRFRGVKCAV